MRAICYVLPVFSVYAQDLEIQLQPMPDNYVPENHPEATPTLNLQAMAQGYAPTNAPITVVNVQNSDQNQQIAQSFSFSDFMTDDIGNLQLFLDPDTGGKVYVLKSNGARISQETVDPMLGLKGET